MSVGKGLFLWAPVALYTALIFWVSSAYRPIPGIELFGQIDKLWHLAEYAPLGSLLMRAIRRSFHPVRQSHAWMAGGAYALAVGILDELTQSFVPMKRSSGMDVLFDVAGALIGQWLYGRRVARTP